MPPTEDRVEISTEGGALVYRTVIMAPDPCYRVPAASEIATADGTLRVTRDLIREPGLCATVMSPLAVEGPVPSVPGGVGRFALVLRDADGQTVFTAEADLP